MFGRDKTSAAPPTDAVAAVPVPKVGGKGRATPTRREAQLRNRKPLIGAPPLPKGATREERKAARVARQTAMREQRRVKRVAQENGDESALALRDRGPARRFVRDYVDARRNLGEYFLPVAGFSILIGFTNLSIARWISYGLLYSLILIIAFDSFLVNRKVTKRVTERFGAEQAQGTGWYAVRRALQIRRARLPKPRVERGNYPGGK